MEYCEICGKETEKLEKHSPSLCNYGKRECCVRIMCNSCRAKFIKDLMYIIYRLVE